MAVSSIADAIAAYNATVKAAKAEPTQPSDGGASATGGLDFGQLLRDGAKDAIDAGKKSEKLSEQALAGKADVRDVVAAVNNAAVTLQTVVAVRDKVINAYNQILQMPI